MQQQHRPKIDVEVQPNPQTQQNVASVLVPRDPRVAERAEQDRVHVVAQKAERGVRQGLSRLEVMIGGVREPFEIEPEAVFRRRALEHRDRCLDDLRPDPVPGDDGDPPHSNPVERPQLAQ